MTDYLTAFFAFFSLPEKQWLLMFTSSFLNSTLLPGNSEIVFSVLTTQSFLEGKSIYSSTNLSLLLIATVGNSLGGLTTYGLARYIPPLSEKQKQKASTQWALAKSQQYGLYMLLLSWLPIIGDLLCAIAGWLRFPFWMSVLMITLGKLVRYGILLVGSYSLFGG